MVPPEPPTEIIIENRWLAQRYGDAGLPGQRAGQRRPGGHRGLRDRARGDPRGRRPQALGCEDELRHALSIIREGSSADRQIDHYRLRRLEGDSEPEALRAVVDLVLAETREGIDASA